jgi:transcriptional regulator with XRE-family HTH domain
MTELRRLRKEKGIPQETLARQARIGQTTLSNYELGRFPVPSKIADRLARILRVESSSLFEKDGDR